MQFGRVIDATLMMDKDTGRPRGFGFVTFDGEEAVERALGQPLEIYGKPMEVKRAQPRANMQAEKRGFGGQQNDRFGGNNGGGGQGGAEQQGGMPAQGAQSGMTPSQLAKSFTEMQKWMVAFQQRAAAQFMMQQMQGGGGMNPAMMNQGMMGGGMPMGGPMGGQAGSPSPGTQAAQQGMMSPGMMQAQMAPQQAQIDQGDYQQGGSDQDRSGSAGPQSAFSPQEQMVFEQQKYERQQQQRMQYAPQGNFNQAGLSSWDGMYDDVPQPNMPPQGPQHGGGQFAPRGRGGFRGNRGQHVPTGPSNAPANAPTGPKNAGRPGSNFYRGGGRGNQRGYHPYNR
jgi:RNA-binding protein Musashi